ncbi:uncharacterized protein PgNI_07714 [Pyricularia grisea]|uniref:Uncharacterized protein n=1 Tax=Pyricularia grisea TaxID=148305 RepID=A0A6P8B0C1_PYRGI|nr:uncharacterized protein PgNI_07714 [Pyricularia grisea]TLD08365.1 hypothetical protein PgNI_07714 [Pyricularia grisea]
MASFPDANDGSVPTRITVKCCHGECAESAAYGFPLCFIHLKLHNAPPFISMFNKNKKHNDNNKEDQSTASEDSPAGSLESSSKPISTAPPVTSNSRIEPIRKRLDGKATARKTINLPRASPMAPITRRPSQPAGSSALNGEALPSEPSRKKRRVDPSSTTGDAIGTPASSFGPAGHPIRDSRSNRDVSGSGKSTRGLRETPASSFYGHSPTVSEVSKTRTPIVELRDLLSADKEQTPGSEPSKAKAPVPVVEASPKVFNQGPAKYWEEHRAMLTSPTGPQLAHERQLHEEQAMKAPAVLTSFDGTYDISGSTITPGSQQPNTHSVNTHHSPFSMSTQSMSSSSSDTLAPQMQKHLLRLYSENQSQLTGQDLNLDTGQGGLNAPNQRRVLFPGATQDASQNTRSQAKHTHNVEQPAVARRLLRCIKRDTQASTTEMSNAESELLPVEERRRWLLSVDAQPVFDNLIYSQSAAQLAPPQSVHLPPRTEPPEPRGAPLFAALNPHSHWCRPRSKTWLEKKESEIESREDRKGRFGMAVESLATSRREEAAANPAPALARDPLPVQANGRSRGKSNAKRPSRGGESGHANGLSKNTAALARMKSQFDAWDIQVWEKDKEQTRKEEEMAQAFPSSVPGKRVRRKANGR